MKSHKSHVLLLAILFSVCLTACGAKQPAQIALQETATITATEKEKSPSTTTAAATSTTVLESAPPSTSKPTEKTSVQKPDPNAPYEVTSPLPAKEKRCLLLDAWGGEITLTFDKAMRYPLEDNAVLWLYAGTAKTGVAVTCKIVPKSGAVYEVSYGVNTEWGRMTYEDDARACLKQFLQDSNVPLNAKDASIHHAMSARYEDGKTEYIIYWRYYFELEDGVAVSGDIGLSKGKLVVQSIRATCKEGDASVQGYLGDAIPLLVPRWKSQ